MFKKILLKTLPYLVALIIGFILYFLSSLNIKLHDLIINIATAFIAIPLLYFFYETVKSFSHKKLNKEIIDYAKMLVDREFLSVLNQLQKIVYSLEKKEFSSKAINNFLSLKKEILENQLSTNKYLGFQVFKHWEISEKALQELLKNPFILEKMEDEQIIAIISVLKCLRELDSAQKINELYIDTHEVAQGYKLESGKDMNPENKEFPDRYILLKHLSKDEFIVDDFGDIPKYNLVKCLKYYKINTKLLSYYIEIIFVLITGINSWLKVTGFEFIIDTKMFRIHGKHFT